MALAFHTLTEVDLAAADAVLMPAFDGSDSYEGELRRYLALQPDGWRLATLGGEAVGAGGATVYDTFAYIGLVGVRPEMQGKGIGRAVMLELLRWLDARGCPAALLDASRSGYPLYASLGFVEDDTVSVFVRGTEGDGRTGASGDGAVERRVRPIGADDLPALLAYDAPRFGADRGRVLAAYLGECAGRAFATYGAEGRITGYLVAQEERLGPWLADGPGDAEALLRAALAQPFAAPPRALAPTANADVERLLARYGFRKMRTLRHMRRGGSPHHERRRRIYGQASFAIG